MEKKIFILDGIIFQQREWFGTRHDPAIGLRATIENGIVYGTFYGVVTAPEADQSVWGQMHDRWGYSEISKFELSDSHLRFVKTYEHRPPIQYHFEKAKDHMWLGRYDGADSGTGQAKCYIRIVPESFFNPE